MTIAKLIKDYRERHNLNMREFGKKCGISHAYVSKLESDRDNTINISSGIYKKLAVGMGMSVDELMKKTEYIERDIKKGKDIEKELNKIVEELETQQGLMFSNEPMDDISKELLIQAIKNNIQMTNQINKKYTPKKYRK